jgi:hypothetical protein
MTYVKPVYQNRVPLPNSVNINIDSHIFFRVADLNGLNLSTFNVVINSANVILNGVFQSGFTGSISQDDNIPTGINVEIIPNVAFSYSQIIDISSAIYNKISAVATDSYSFTTEQNPDISEPIVVATPHGATYNSHQSVSLNSTDGAAVIYYTLDGSIPTSSSLVYSTPIAIILEGNTTLKFIAIDPSNITSRVITEVYTIDTMAPVSSALPVGGSFFESQSIVLSVNDAEAMIYYTTDGSIPTLSSTVYTVPIVLVDNQVTVIKFFAIDNAGNQENYHTETYSVEISKNNYIPSNVFVTCPFNRNEMYIRWDDMHAIYDTIVGYNIYRADVETGPYTKLNDDLIAVTQYLDKTLDIEVVSEDVSDQFRRIVNISRQVNDDFYDGFEFNKTKWKEHDSGQLLFQNQGAWFKDAVGLEQSSKLESIFKLKGNFDINVSFYLAVWNVLSGTGSQSCQFVVKKNDHDYVEISRSMSHVFDVYASQQYINGNPELPLTVTTSDVKGIFRITRVNDIVTTYYYDRGTNVFVQLGAYDGYVEDLYVEIRGKSANNNHVEMQFTDFTVVSGNPIIIEPLNPRKEYVIYLSKRPVVDNTGLNNPTDDSSNVSVTIDGEQAYVRLLQGIEGLIQLETEEVYDEIKGQWFKPPVPNEFSTVLVTYKIPKQTTNIHLRKNYFYKVACVTPEDETDIDLVVPENLKPEKMSYIYEEAVRRNSWLLDQAGERTLLYIKKKAGKTCHCVYRDLKERTHRRPDQDCETCFGSGFDGGFDGPFPIRIGPLTTEQRIQQTDRGLKLMYQIETWMGPAPVVSQRDMIVRRNGDRCLVGPITPVEGPGGVMTQQHFVIEILDNTDIRYKFGVLPLPDKYHSIGINKNSTYVLDGKDLNVSKIDSPKEREELFTSEDKVSHENENVDHIVKGRSISFENINF